MNKEKISLMLLKIGGSIVIASFIPLFYIIFCLFVEILFNYLVSIREPMSNFINCYLNNTKTIIIPVIGFIFIVVSNYIRK